MNWTVIKFPMLRLTAKIKIAKYSHYASSHKTVKIFSRENFSSYGTTVHVCVLKIFGGFKFPSLRRLRKFLNAKNFPNYSITVYTIIEEVFIALKSFHGCQDYKKSNVKNVFNTCCK